MRTLNQVRYNGHTIKVWCTKDGSRIVYDVILPVGVSRTSAVNSLGEVNEQRKTVHRQTQRNDPMNPHAPVHHREEMEQSATDAMNAFSPYR